MTGTEKLRKENQALRKEIQDLKNQLKKITNVQLVKHVKNQKPCLLVSTFTIYLFNSVFLQSVILFGY